MRLEISNVDKNILGEIATLIAGTEATIKVVKEEVEKPKNKETKESKPTGDIYVEHKSCYVPWQEQWEDMMTAINWGRK